MEKITLCPYCKEKLPKFPSRKGKCPTCNEIYFVRTEPVSRERIVITESQIKQNEQAWSGYYAVSEFKKILTEIAPDLFEELYRQSIGIQQKQSQKKLSGNDILWGISNRMIVESIKNNSIDSIRQIYWAQSEFLHNEGKDYIYIMQKSFELELRALKKQGLVKSVEIVTGKDVSCLECQKLDGKVLILEEALEQKLLPCRQCMRKINADAPTGFCRCLYVSVF